MLSSPTSICHHMSIHLSPGYSMTVATPSSIGLFQENNRPSQTFHLANFINGEFVAPSNGMYTLVMFPFALLPHCVDLCVSYPPRQITHILKSVDPPLSLSLFSVSPLCLPSLCYCMHMNMLNVLTHTGEYFDNYDPSCGKVYSKIPDSQPADVATAVEAADAALPAWSALTAQDRSKYMHKIADAIEARLEEYVHVYMCIVVLNSSTILTPLPSLLLSLSPSLSLSLSLLGSVVYSHTYAHPTPCQQALLN
eukprot:TRINITY_DN3597_c0_g2_i9.p1 TRINITY_DN3597_c0_g2~~TRINITY_DN3597_c0_g2_i9.p1  ORF type:complete len:252 (+),score=33.16 TRINITY_DN3597_c0_g2_i9:76-831(+)